jgi:hypothetical protein
VKNTNSGALEYELEMLVKNTNNDDQEYDLNAVLLGNG